MPLESSLVSYLHTTLGTGGVWAWVTGILASSFLPYLLGIAALVALFRVRPFRARVWSFALIGLSLVLGRGIIAPFLGLVWDRPRPFLALGFQPTFLVNLTSAFPSGHTTFLIGLAAAVFIVNRRWGTWLGIGALFVGVARIAAGVHWPTDVLCGIAAGILGAWAGWLLIRQYRPGASPEPAVAETAAVSVTTESESFKA